MTTPDLAGKRILVVEDESLISMLLELALQDEGSVVVGPAARVDEALELARIEVLDGAFLDVNLVGEPVFPVAQMLESRGVPFLLLSGYGDQAVPEGRDWPICSKPFDVDSIMHTLNDLIRKGTAAAQPEP